MALVALSAPLSAQTGVVQAEDTLARQVRDSVPPLVEVAADTLRADTLYIGELVPDTLAVPDSLRADTLAVPDTIALPDTLRADTVALADSLPADSLAKPAAPPKKVKTAIIHKIIFVEPTRLYEFGERPPPDTDEKE